MRRKPVLDCPRNDDSIEVTNPSRQICFELQFSAIRLGVYKEIPVCLSNKRAITEFLTIRQKEF